MSKSGVPYADQALHAVRGCTKISRGCRHCYACTLAATRLSNNLKYHGLAVTGKRHDPSRPLKQRMVSMASWRDIRTYPEELRAPLRRRKPAVWFVADMGDLFHERVPFAFIAAVFGIMAATTRHTYLLLTKRPERMRRWYEWIERLPVLMATRKTWPNLNCTMAAHDADREFMVPDGRPRFGVTLDQPWPLPNVWPGTSAEGQPELDERVPQLLRVPVHPEAGHWLSLEPQLEAVDASNYLVPVGVGGSGCRFSSRLNFAQVMYDEHEQCAPWCGGCGEPGPRPALRAVIQGSEQLSGGRCGRFFDVDWAISMHRQCQDAGVSYYYKQAPGKGAKVDKLPQLHGQTWRQLPWRP